MEIYQATIEDLEGAQTYIKKRLESKDSVIFVVKDKQNFVFWSMTKKI